MSEALDLNKLNEIFSKSQSCDKKLFAEYKNNVLMEAGQQWNSVKRRLDRRLSESGADQQTKVRLTKNHISVILGAIKNQIASKAPWTRPFPHAESEAQDQKAAEIALAVWNDAKHRYNLQEKRDRWLSNFCIIGETGAVKIFWDPNKGKLVGYEQATDEHGQLLYEDQLGQVTTQAQIVDELGQVIGENKPKSSDKAVMSGDFVFETILPFNLRRDPACETLEESPYLGIEKMMELEDVKKLAQGDEAKIDKLKASAETTFRVFDNNIGDYVDSKDQVLVKEIYYRPCSKYPNGQFAIWTTECMLVEPQELPHGIFPIVDSEGYKNIVTTPRGISEIRNLRPLQANLNQLASQKMQHELTVGDDKLVLSGGSKVEKGSDFPGIRTIKVTGAPPTVISGRVGDQFLASIQAITDEMYRIAGVEYLLEEISGQMDPNAMLFRSMRQKVKFSGPAEKFERFLTKVNKLYLQLHRLYATPEMIIKATSRNEHVNISEWQNVSELDYMIKLEPVGEDIESALGRNLQITSILQYAGDKIPPEALPQIISAMPHLNSHEMFGNLMQDETDAKNVVLALDRGEMPTPRKYDNHKYIIKKLNSRMRERSFDLLDPQIQKNYEDYILAQEQFENEEITQIKNLQAQTIPTSGALVTVQLYESVPNSSGGVKTQFMKMPTDTILWVKKALETQGTYLEQFEQLPQNLQAQIAQQNNQASSIPAGQAQPMGQNPQGALDGSSGQQSVSSGGEFYS